MNPSRREFLGWTAGGAGSLAAAWLARPDRAARYDVAEVSPAFSVIPVVGDGHWVWNDPPAEVTGYLEPRKYSLDVGIELEGVGGADGIHATTPVPVAHPEQTIDSVQLETEGCTAELRELAPGMAQLCLSADSISKGEKIKAIAHYELTICKQYHAYERDQFPAKQQPPADVRNHYLQDSPGIQTRARQVQQLARELSAKLTHPWDIARSFAEWIPKNIRPQIGTYTSVTAALDKRLGDCEEMTAVFVALCRSAGIPARVVWVPNHNWAEFYLHDDRGEGHWIPAHLACYFWFGWTGVHELVIQKGDRVHVAEQHKRVRLLEDWLQYEGRKPRARYVGEITPLASAEGEEAGPGHRSKDASGEWKIVGTHPYDRYMRR